MSKNFLDLLSTHFLICNEKIRGLGEDSGLEAYNCEAGMMAVFDGCGGLGAKTCASISNKTEAYVASRAIGSAAKSWFHINEHTGYDWNLDTLKELMISNLEMCQNNSGETGIRMRGSLIRPFPSTTAMITFKIKGKSLYTEHIWAGDSRTYVLDNQGLGQISVDDIKSGDAMSNLTKDGALTNVVSVDQRFKLHRKTFIPKMPCIMLCATDGCFGYVSSPMEFEYMLLSNLMNADNVVEWQKNLNNDIFRRAGDDQTIAVAAFGFESFDDLKNYYIKRYHLMRRIVEDFAKADEEQKQKLWEVYKPEYYRNV